MEDLPYVYKYVSFILTFILLLVHGFHMIIAMCSYARSKIMSVSQELRDYLSALIQPLATNVCLEEIIQTLKEV